MPTATALISHSRLDRGLWDVHLALFIARMANRASARLTDMVEGKQARNTAWDSKPAVCPRARRRKVGWGMGESTFTSFRTIYSIFIRWIIQFDAIFLSREPGECHEITRDLRAPIHALPAGRHMPSMLVHDPLTFLSELPGTAHHALV